MLFKHSWVTSDNVTLIFFDDADHNDAGEFLVVLMDMLDSALPDYKISRFCVGEDSSTVQRICNHPNVEPRIEPRSMIDICLPTDDIDVFNLVDHIVSQQCEEMSDIDCETCKSKVVAHKMTKIR